MNKAYRFSLAVFCAGLLFCQGCSKEEKPRIKEDIKDAENSIEKAYDRTTDAMRDVVDGINDAVYK